MYIHRKTMSLKNLFLTTRLQGAAREAQEVLGEEQVLVGAQLRGCQGPCWQNKLQKSVSDQITWETLRVNDEKNHCQSLSKVVRLLEKCTNRYIPDFLLTDAAKLLALQNCFFFGEKTAQNKKLMKFSSTSKTTRFVLCFLFCFFKGTVYVYFGDRQPWFSILWIRMKGNAFEYFPLFRSAIDSTCSNDQRRFSVKCKHFIEKKRRRTKLPTGMQNSVFLAFTNPYLEFSKCSFKRTQSFCMNYTF